MKPPSRADSKTSDALRTIGEVAEQLDVPHYVLRFWETKFPQITPEKHRGRRYYRPQDIVVLQQIKTLLYNKKYTIKGVQAVLASIRPASGLMDSLQPGLPTETSSHHQDNDISASPSINTQNIQGILDNLRISRNLLQACLQTSGKDYTR